MARPTKFTGERRARFLAALASGVFPETAARLAGWSPASLYRFARLGTPEAAAFRQDITRVVTELEVRLAGTVTKAALADPRLALALLERRFGERWARRAAPQSPDEPLEPTPVAAQPVMLDQATIDRLVPKLLEARTESGRRIGDIDRFAVRKPSTEDPS
jgi:hypothetical protein